MTEYEIMIEVKGINKYSKKLLANKKEADNFFKSIGIYDSDGNLTKLYGGKTRRTNDTHPHNR